MTDYKIPFATSQPARTLQVTVVQALDVSGASSSRLNFPPPPISICRPQPMLVTETRVTVCLLLLAGGKVSHLAQRSGAGSRDTSHARTHTHSMQHGGSDSDSDRNSDTVTLQCHIISRYTCKCDVTLELIPVDITTAVPADRPGYCATNRNCSWSINVTAAITNSFALASTV